MSCCGSSMNPDEVNLSNDASYDDKTADFNNFNAHLINVVICLRAFKRTHGEAFDLIHSTVKTAINDLIIPNGMKSSE